MDDMYNEELMASSQSRGRSQEKEQKKIEDKSPNDKDLYYPKKPGPPGPLGPPNDPGDGGGRGGGGPLTLQDYLHCEDHREIHKMMS